MLKVTIISDKYGEFKVNADETMKIHDFKRVILNYIKKPFFLEFEIGNEKTLSEYLQKSKEIVKVYFDINEWSCKAKNICSGNEITIHNVSKETLIEDIEI